MALLDEIRQTCVDLAGQGWRDLLLDVTRGGFDMLSDNLAEQLVAPLASIDRTAPGFEDYALSGSQAIEAGSPARSLLYHALASPFVTSHKGVALGAFPTLAQIETVENYVYGVDPPTLDSLRENDNDSHNDIENGNQLGIVVFALEYRPAIRTPHHRHADLCFSRTGIARVGTTSASYDAPTRQWSSLDPDDPYAFRVSPVRYAPFIARLLPGQAGVLPDRFVDGDDKRSFWVPIHKLFNGDECIAGLTLDLDWSVGHINEKLFRLHSYLQANGYDTGWEPGQITQPPFRFTDDIAELSTDPADGVGVIVPAVHARLVEPAVFNDKPLALKVAPDLKPTRPHSQVVLEKYFSGLEVKPGGPFPIASVGQTLTPIGRSHPASEIINGRHKVLSDGSEQNLNDLPNVDKIVAAGGFWARHFLDFSGDGWVGVTCSALAPTITTARAAYSVVAGPDFFPYCDQLPLLEWAETLPAEIRSGLWTVLPRALSDSRIATNQQLVGAGFAPPAGPGLTDTTATAMVCQLEIDDGQPQIWPAATVQLKSSLPDGASGVFDPGWDVTTDVVTDTDVSQLFLTAYGLGTPFVEDAKICAALGTYWPAVAPDATRTFQPDKFWPTVSPLTDEEIGMVGDMPWDGIKGPVRVGTGPTSVIEFTDIDYADYVDQALASRFTAALTSQIDLAEYCDRVQSMAMVYNALGITLPPDVGPNGKQETLFVRMQVFLLAKAVWNVLHYRVEPSDDAGVAAALAATGHIWRGSKVYGGTLFRHGKDNQGPTFKLRHIEILEEVDFYTDLFSVLTTRGGEAWQVKTISMT
jgi:hypothetical protein